MILLIVLDYFWGNKQSCASEIRRQRIARKWCNFLLLLNKHFVLLIMAVIMILRVSKVSTLDVVSTHTNMTFPSALLAPTSYTNLTPNKLISIPADDILNAEDSEDYIEESVELYDELINNKSAKGIFVGAPCEFTCDKRLHHMFCNPISNKCECEKNYPVVIGLKKGCAKPKKLGEQCLYLQTCIFNDENSLCMQINHNAICQCKEGYHLTTHTKPTRRTFCTQDMSVADLPTLLGVTTGIAVLAGLICMVLHLISKTKYPRSRNFADTHQMGPPIMYASDTGIPLTIQSNRPSSRSSQRSSGSIGSYTGRRSSGAQTKGVQVSQSRTGSRRPSINSVHSTSSSVRSYSSKRFEQERYEKETRQEMKKHLCRLQEQQQLQKIRPNIIIGDSIPYTVTKQIIPSPSPHILTPNSTDELLPSVDEITEIDEFSPYFDRRFGP
ncbi:unnamed protein product [Diamesa serratosioi]